MPKKDGKLTPPERVFAEAMATTGDQTYAQRQAGYKSSAGSSMAMQRPAIQQEIARIQLERIFNEVLPLAVQVHMDLLRSSTTPAGAKVQAVKLAYDYGFADKDADGKEPHEMTAEELQRTIERLQRAKADKARPVIDNPPQDAASVFA